MTEELRKRVNDWKHPPKHFNLRTNDEFLSRFLAVAKDDVEKAYKRYKVYYELVQDAPDMNLLTKASDEDRKVILSKYKDMHNGTTEFHGFDKHGRGIFTFRIEGIMKHADTENLHLGLVINILIVIENIMKQHPTVRQNGVVIIESHKGMTLTFIRKVMGIKFARWMGNFFSGAFPTMVKNLWIADEPPFIGMIFKLIKPFLSKKILERLYFVGQNYHLIEENVGGKEFLPEFVTGERKPTNLIPEMSDEEFLEQVKTMLGLK